MNCEEFENLIIPYETDDDFDNDLGEKFKRHYLTCDACWEKYESYLKVFAALESEKMSKALEEEPEPDRVEELIEYAEAFQETGDLQDALKCVEEALELRPGDETIEAKHEEIKSRLLDYEKKHTAITATFPNTLKSLEGAMRGLFGSLFEDIKKTFKELDVALLGIQIPMTGRVLEPVESEDEHPKPPVWDRVFKGNQAVQIKFGDHVIQAVRLVDEKEWVFTAYYRNTQPTIKSILLQWKHNGETRKRIIDADEQNQAILNDDDFDPLLTYSDVRLTISLKRL
jgi:tetratricopeptide (TPR) repeat protein